MIDFTLENPGTCLRFILDQHKEAFFNFLLNGSTKNAGKLKMKQAIDLFLEIESDEYANDYRMAKKRAELSINQSTLRGVQNTKCIQFFCEILEDKNKQL